MNFDRFKNIKINVKADGYDKDYVSSLNSLPSAPQKKNILPILGTVAAALVMVVGISMWALIGRGVRGGLQTNEPTQPPAADSTQIQIDFDNRKTEMSSFVESTKEYELDDKTVAMFKAELIDKHDLANIPIFTETDPLTPKQVENYAVSRDFMHTVEALNQFAYDLFNIKDMFEQDYMLSDNFIVNKDVNVTFTSIAEHKLTSGHRIIVVQYSVGNAMHTLEYIAGDGIEVDWFRLHILNSDSSVTEPPVVTPEQEVTPVPPADKTPEDMPVDEVPPVVMPDFSSMTPPDDIAFAAKVYGSNHSKLNAYYTFKNAKLATIIANITYDADDYKWTEDHIIKLLYAGETYTCVLEADRPYISKNNMACYIDKKTADTIDSIISSQKPGGNFITIENCPDPLESDYYHFDNDDSKELLNILESFEYNEPACTCQKRYHISSGYNLHNTNYEGYRLIIGESYDNAHVLKDDNKHTLTTEERDKILSLLKK